MRLFISQDPKICWILSITLWIELIFCMLTAMQYFWLDRHPTPFVWLLNASILQLYLLDPVQWPEESYEIWSAHPSVPSFFRSGVFFKLYRHFFKFWYGARNPYEVVREEPDSPKKILENGPKMGQKQVFFIYWEIWSLIFTEFFLWLKFILFTVFLHKYHIWENYCSWDMGQNVLNQSEQINKLAWFLHVETNSYKLIVEI